VYKRVLIKEEITRESKVDILLVELSLRYSIDFVCCTSSARMFARGGGATHGVVKLQDFLQMEVLVVLRKGPGSPP